MKAWNHANASEVVNTTRENHKYIQIQSNLIKYRTLPAIFGLSQLWSRRISLCQQEQPRNTAFCIVWLDAVSYRLNFVGRDDLTSWVIQLLLMTHNMFLCDSRWEKHGEGQSIVFVGVPCRLLADGEQLGQGVQFVPWLRHLHVVDRCDPWRILLYPVAVEQLVAWDFWMRSNRSRKLVPLHHSIPTGTIFFGGASSCMFATIIYN